MKAKHIVVTGGAGFIGSHLTERLLNDGKKVVVIDDLSTGHLGNLRHLESHASLHILVSTVSGCPTLGEWVDGAEAIYHLAAAVGVDLVVKSPIRTIHTNLKETEAILETASRQGIPVLIASSSEVYGKSTRPVFHEDDDLPAEPGPLELCLLQADG
jgi:UDP-glucose 4-epimerase